MSLLAAPTIVMGLDLGDKYSQLCVLDAEGEVIEESRIRTRELDLIQRFDGIDPVRIVIEVGTQSPWVSRLLESMGHEVLVADPRKLPLIYTNNRKSDRTDAELLARLGRFDPKLLSPVQHRSAEMQADLEVVRIRKKLVEARTKLINHVRGATKSAGVRLPSSSTDSFHHRVRGKVPADLQPAIDPLLETIEHMTKTIKHYDRLVRNLAEKKYAAATGQLTQIRGVGPLTALAFVLTLQHPDRFKKSRSVGAYLGMVRALDESGESKPDRHITKAGNKLLRCLLVQSAHYILGPFGIDCDLRRKGERIMSRGGKGARKRAAVAVARQLAVVMHRLWKSGATYQPLRNEKQKAA